MFSKSWMAIVENNNLCTRAKEKNGFNKRHYSACKSWLDNLKHPEVSTQLSYTGSFQKTTVIAGKRCSCLLFCCWVLVRSQHRAGFRITFGFVLALEPWWSTSFLPQSNLRFLFVLAQLCLFCNGISPGIDLDSLDCGLVSLNVSQECPWRLTEHYNPPLCNDCKIRFFFEFSKMLRIS